VKILLISGTDDLDKHKYVSFLRTHGLYFLQELLEKEILCKYFEKKTLYIILTGQVPYMSFLCNQFHKFIRRPFICIMIIRICILNFFCCCFSETTEQDKGQHQKVIKAKALGTITNEIIFILFQSKTLQFWCFLHYYFACF